MRNRLRHVMAGRAAWVLALGVVLAAALGGGASLSRVPAQAASPSGATLTVPAGGVGTVSTSWTGSVPPGTNALAIRCVDFTGTTLDNLTDTFLLQVSGVSDAFYLTHRVQLIVRITWTPTPPGNYQTNDLGLTTYLRDNSGNLTNFRDSHQLGSNFEQVAYSNPPAATGMSNEPTPQPVAYHLNTCPDNSATAQSYQGTATLISGLIPSSANVTPGAQTFTNYDFPVTYQTKSPPAATFKDVTPPQQGVVNEDAILTIDHHTNRTQAAGLLIAGSNVSLSDNDGTSWTQGTFPLPHSPDHETINGGPYHSPAPPLAGKAGYPDAVYYCSQNVVQAAGAFCGRSDTGGVTWNPSTLVFAGTDCGAIHGHVKVGPDGTVYLPQRACGATQGMAVSFDNGATWVIERVPDGSTIGLNSSDPSVAPAPDGKTLYYAYQDGFGNPAVAVSSDRGKDGTWSPSTNVGAPFAIKNTKFPEIVVGDPDRAAVTFLGTTTPGDDQAKRKTAPQTTRSSADASGCRAAATRVATPWTSARSRSTATVGLRPPTRTAARLPARRPTRSTPPGATAAKAPRSPAPLPAPMDGCRRWCVSNVAWVSSPRSMRRRPSAAVEEAGVAAAAVATRQTPAGLSPVRRADSRTSNRTKTPARTTTRTASR